MATLSATLTVEDLLLDSQTELLKLQEPRLQPPIPASGTKGSVHTSPYILPTLRPEVIPFCVIEHVDLRARMHDHLSELLRLPEYVTRLTDIAERKTVTAFEGLYDAFEDQTLDSTLDSHSEVDAETSTADLSYMVRKAATHLYRQLALPPGASWLEPKRECSSKDTHVNLDGFISNAEGRQVIWENKAVIPFEHFFPVDWYGKKKNWFEDAFERNWDGTESILGKLSHYTMVGPGGEGYDYAAKLGWGVVFGGRQYMIVLMLTIWDGEHDRIALVCSPPTPVHDPAPGALFFPLTTAIVYMLLTSGNTWNSTRLMEALSVPAIDPPKPFKLGREEADRTMLSLRTRQKDESGGSNSPSASLPGGSSKADLDGMAHICIENDMCGAGVTGTVYRLKDAGHVVKLSRAGRTSVAALLTEAGVYEHLQEKGLHSIPSFEGMYECTGGLALILSDEGQSLSDLGLQFTKLTLSTRAVLYRQLVRLHAAGVIHGDFRRSNVLYRRGKTCIIDFSNSRLHTCAGIGQCNELEDAWQVLAPAPLRARRFGWWYYWACLVSFPRGSCLDMLAAAMVCVAVAMIMMLNSILPIASYFL